MARAGDIKVALRESRVPGLFFRNGSFRDVQKIDEFRASIREEPDFTIRVAHYMFQHHVRDEDGNPFTDVGTVDEVAELDMDVILEAAYGYYRRDAD